MSCYGVDDEDAALVLDLDQLTRNSLSKTSPSKVARGSIKKVCRSQPGRFLFFLILLHNTLNFLFFPCLFARCRPKSQRPNSTLPRQPTRNTFEEHRTAISLSRTSSLSLQKPSDSKGALKRLGSSSEIKEQGGKGREQGTGMRAEVGPCSSS